MSATSLSAPRHRPLLRSAAGGALGAALVTLCLLGGCSVAGTVSPAKFEDEPTQNGTEPSTELPTGGGGAEPNDATSTSPNDVATGGGNGAGPVATNPNDGNAPAPTPQRQGPGVAMYWGTGNENGQDADISTLCGDGDTRIIILSFFDTIASYSQNANGAPHMSINDCPRPFNAQNPRLGRCPELGTKIEACQTAGVQVVASIGGGGAKVGFQNDVEAKAYAQLIWNMFLGGKSSIRPFGSATLDGIDLDVEGGTTVGWAAFVLQLRALMNADKTKSYLITAAPQCPFRDAWMGPDGASFDGKPLRGTALGLALTSFDHLFVQFYNNYCRFTSPSEFAAAYKAWTTLGPVQPKVWVGLPATTIAADAASFVAGANLTKVVAAAQSSPNFGGIMFWDAGYDADTIKKGSKAMRLWAAEALAGVQRAD